MPPLPLTSHSPPTHLPLTFLSPSSHLTLTPHSSLLTPPSLPHHSLNLTPNPATERVTVSATGMQSVELLAVDGMVIMRREGLRQDEYLLDLKGLAAGVYMVRVSTPLGTATRRLMVQ